MSAIISQAEGPHRQVSPDEDGIRNAREVTAGAREQIDITSKLVDAKMKTTAEPHVKEELNHMQATTLLQ